MRDADNMLITKTPPRAVAWIAIMTLVFFVFSGSLKNDFVDWDDTTFIKDNPMIQSLTPNNLWKMATNIQTGNWHPLTWLSHAIDYRFFQLNPAGHRLTNITLHSLNAVWVFLLFTRLVGKTGRGLKNGQSLLVGGIIASLLFGVHPLRVESVAWISERKDLLCAFFVLATYWVYLSYVFAAEKKSRALWYIAALFLFLLALMSKPMAVTVPITLLLLDAFPLRRWKSRADIFPLALEKLPFFCLSLISGTVTLIAQKQAGAVVAMTELSLPDRLMNAAKSLLFYMGKTLWPTHLVPLYPFPTSVSLLNGGLLPAATGLITVVCLLMWRNHRQTLPVAWFYYLITVAPVIGIIQAGRQAAADRYTYLPTLSFYFLIGIGVVWLWEKNSSSAALDAVRRSLILLGGIIALSGLGYLTVQQAKIWKNSETLWNYVVESFPGRSALAEYGLGKSHSQKGLWKEAEAKYKAALEIEPGHFEALNGLGLIYYERGLYEEAETAYKRALAIHPDTAAHNNLGTLYFNRGRLDEAHIEFLAALKLNPDNVEAHSNLGVIYFNRGRFDLAHIEFLAALRLNPNNPGARNNLELLHRSRGRLKKPS